MRLCFKKLRDALEFMTPLQPARQMKRYLETLSALQEPLGLINDSVTAWLLIEKALGDKHGTEALWVGWRNAGTSRRAHTADA